MANKAGTAPQVIALPQGGGAQRGLGETFSPDLQTGTGNFTVPIALPAGRNGFQPQLNLVYSSGQGNGPFGLGWALSIPGVRRKTSKGVPRYRDDGPGNQRDTFILSGAEDLVRVSAESAEPARYRPRTEGGFALIERTRGPAGDYWEVSSKDGLISRYGTPRPSAASGSWRDRAAIANPLDAGQIFAWKLTKTEDPFKNRIQYDYLTDGGELGPHRWDQSYLERIAYVDYLDGGLTKFLVTVAFEYEERTDAFSDHRAGFEIRTRLRCSRIVIKTHADRERIVRSYRFAYDEAALNRLSLLHTVDVLGSDGLDRLPPLEFGYTSFEPDRRRDLFPVAGDDRPPASLARADYELADLTGDGLPDILQMNGAVRYWRNVGNGRFDRPRQMPEAPAGLRLADPSVQLMDADGDGRVDLVVSRPELAGYYPLRFDGHWDHASFSRYRQTPSFSLDDPQVKLVDLDGDGVTDAIRSGTRMECFFADPDVAGWIGTRPVERRALSEFPNVTFTDPRVKWGDLTGDGLQDIALIHDGNVEYWPSLGHGRWGRRVSMRRSPSFPYGYDPRRILIGDVNGDGLADIVYVADGKITLWINQSGDCWSDSVEIIGTPQVSDMDAVRLVDLLGSGISGVLWTSDASPRLPRANMHFLDLTGAVKPYLLDVMDNHLGAVTRVEYRSSTYFYVEDRKLPGTRWRTPLPFPVQVVARVEVVDSISKGKLTTEYRYRHGYWDGGEQEYRGFGRVDQLDSETFKRYDSPGLHGPETDFEPIADETLFSPPTLTKTWFHLGPVGDEFGEWDELDLRAEFWSEDPPAFDRHESATALLAGLQHRDRRDALRALRGSVLRTELYALDGTTREGRPYTVTESQYGLREEAQSGPAERGWRRIYFPFVITQRTTRWERGDDPMTQVNFYGDYDAFGQPTTQTSVALPRRQACRRPVTGALVGTIAGDEINETLILATHTRTEYSTPDAELYLHDRVAHVRVYELANASGVAENDPGNVIRYLLDANAEARAAHEQFDETLRAWQAGQPLPPGLRLIGHILRHYDGNAFVGRDAGQVGPFGALVRTEALVLTSNELQAAYGADISESLGGARSPPSGTPAGFGTSTGYRPEQSSPGGYHTGLYADVKRQAYDFQAPNPVDPRGVVTGLQDALGHETAITADRYSLLPVEVIDAAGLTTQADYGAYRFLLPERVTDANGHMTHIEYTPLGLPRKIVLEGRDGEGGTAARPEVEYLYDFDAFDRTRDDQTPQPMSVQTRQRIWHAADGISDDVVKSREYSDGFGRVVQKRATAPELVFGPNGDAVGLLEDGQAVSGHAGGPAVGQRNASRVVVSGWQVYDNKGRTVKRYEPYFATGWGFQPRGEAQQGQHVTLFYDPRGQVVRTLNPDGSEARVTFGVSNDMTSPDLFAPTPWERYAHDPNDLAPLSISSIEVLPNGSPTPLSARAPAEHHFTPANDVLDAMGRTLCSVARNGPMPDDDWLVTRTAYDLRGNVVEVLDAHGRRAFRHAYDLLNRPLRADSMDAGSQTTVIDGAGNPIEHRDSRGLAVLREYDALNRPTHVWAQSVPTGQVTLRERRVYGDELNRTNARRYNQLGRIYRQYDEAGLVQVDGYDFKGNVVARIRQVIADAQLAIGWVADWGAANADDALDPMPYRSDIRFDALNRQIEFTSPEDVNGDRAVLVTKYDLAGGLESLDLDGQSYVRQIAYNAKGQRVLIAYGNGLMTRYSYDPRTFRLVRLRTEAYEDPPPSPDEWAGRAAPLEELTYSYDLVGNITAIEDRTLGSGVASSVDGRNRLVRAFRYDPLYRLVEATGRACQDAGQRPGPDLGRCGSYPSPYVPGPPVPNQNNAPDLTEGYAESFQYDHAGNILRLAYQAASGNWTRVYGIGGLPPAQWRDAPYNRVTRLVMGGIGYDYQYDANGNLTRQNTERRYDWDHANRLIAFSIQPAGSPNPSVEARYLYGADGRRVKKWVRTGNATNGESTVYVDDLFEHHRWTEGGVARQNGHLHLLDGQGRVAVVRRGPADPRDAGPPVQFHLGDHLGSSGTVVDGSARWVNREEYFPYGETSFGSFARKRFRFAGKEHDDESGLSYHGARYYSPFLARWAGCDPARPSDETNPYLAFKDSPVRYVDPSGRSAADAGTVSGGVALTGTEGRHERADVESYRKDEVAGYVSRSTTATTQLPGPENVSQDATPLTRREDNVGHPRPALSSGARPPDASEHPPAGYRVGIGINVSDVTKFGDVNAGRNVGHTVVYATDPEGRREVLSLGPSRSVERYSADFLTGNLEATPTYGLDKKDEYNLYEWSVTETQFDKARTFIANTRADAGMYTLQRQCTSVAIETARAAGINVPEGLGEISHPWIPYNPTVSTPYHLDKELQESRHRVPVTVEASHFKDQLKIK